MTNQVPVQKKKNDTWGQILVGILCIAAAAYLHNLFTDLETGVIQSTRLNSIIVLMYKTLGHIPTVLIIAGLGVIFIIVGIRALIMRFTNRNAG